MSQLPLKDQYTAAVTGVFGDSSITYMLVQSGKLSSQDGSAGSYMLKALTLTGSAAGFVLDVPNNITVSDNLAFYANQAAAGGGGGTKNWLFVLFVVPVMLCLCYGFLTQKTARGIIIFD